MKKFSFLPFLLIIAIYFLQACGGEDLFRVDYSQVPPPFDQTEAVRDSVLPQGVTIYVTEEGDGQFEVTYKDVILVKYTGRTEDGEIFRSSYAVRFRGDTLSTSSTLSNLYPYTIIGSNGRQDPPLIEGFRKGLYGMRPGEKRIIVVPPEMVKGGQLRTNVDINDKTLVYNVELVQIAGVPRDEH